MEAFWEANKTQRNAKVTFLDWLDWSSKLSKQDPAVHHLVLYSASAKDANAMVIEEGAFDRPFVVDYAAYWHAASSRAEADYLCAFLNAGEPNRIIKDFQARGLMGPRHISKTILEVPLPRFDPTDADHAALAELGADCATKAAAWLEGGGADPPFRVGAVRLALRKHLATELKQIDRVLKRLV